MVMCPDKAPDVIGDTYQRQAHQRRFRHIEAACALVCQPAIKTLFLLIRRNSPPVFLHKWQLNSAMHRLKRLILRLPGKCSAQRRMPTDHIIPGAGKGGYIDIRLQRTDQLLDIHTGVGSIETVEQQALLDRRKRIDGFDIPHVRRSIHTPSP